MEKPELYINEDSLKFKFSVTEINRSLITLYQTVSSPFTLSLGGKAPHSRNAVLGSKGSNLWQ